MASLVKQYLQAQNLEVLVESGLEDAVMRFVDKDDRDAIKEYVVLTVHVSPQLTGQFRFRHITQSRSRHEIQAAG